MIGGVAPHVTRSRCSCQSRTRRRDRPVGRRTRRRRSNRPQGVSVTPAWNGSWNETTATRVVQGASRRSKCGLSDPQMARNTRASGLLSRASQVRILPGAPLFIAFDTVVMRLRPGASARPCPPAASGSYQAIVYPGTNPLTRKPTYRRETAKTWDLAEVALTRGRPQNDPAAHRQWRSPGQVTVAAGETSTVGGE